MWEVDVWSGKGGKVCGELRFGMAKGKECYLCLVQLSQDIPYVVGRGFEWLNVQGCGKWRFGVT